jgi:hypothetical protein
MQYLAFACRVALITVFGVSAATKLRGPGAFLDSLRDMRVLPGATVRPIGITVVAAELAVPILLALPWQATEPVGYCLAIALLAAFAVVIVRSVRRGDRTPCRCFGRSSTPPGREHVTRNALLIALAVIGLGVGLGAIPADDRGTTGGLALATPVRALAATPVSALAALPADLRHPTDPQQRSSHLWISGAPASPPKHPCLIGHSRVRSDTFRLRHTISRGPGPRG